MNKHYLKYTANKRVKPLVDVGIFSFLIISFHFLYIWWGNSGFWPIEEQVNQFFKWGSRVLFEQSDWVISKIGIDYYKEGQTFYITARDGSIGWLEVAPGCTALKQWGHWVFLMVLFPGEWRYKVWFIPSGVLIIQVISLVRVSGLAMVLKLQPHYFNLYHDYVFKALFYGGIFLLWILCTKNQYAKYHSFSFNFH